MTNVSAVDPYTVQMTFSAPDPDVIFALASYPGIMVSPNGLAQPSELTMHPMGSGPYELGSVSAALTFTLNRWDGYWDKSVVHPAVYQDTNSLDEGTRFNAVKTGQTTFTQISALNYAAAKADNNLQLVTYPNLGTYVVYMNNKVAPFNNPQVLQAVDMAFNRSAFEASQSGLCHPVNQAFPPGLDGYSTSISGPPMDVAQAKQLISSAGATGATVKLLDIAFEPYPTFAQLVQAQLDAIGLSVKIVQQPGAVFRTVYAQGGYGMLLANLSMTSPDPSSLLDLYVTGSGNPGTKDPALIAQVAHAEQLPIGSKERTAAMQAINNDLTTKDVLWAPLCQGTSIFVGSKKLIGLNALPNVTLSSDAVFSHLEVAK
jgi:ABC-type transport system substrate-binding protein